MSSPFWSWRDCTATIVAAKAEDTRKTDINIAVNCTPYLREKDVLLQFRCVMAVRQFPSNNQMPRNGIAITKADDALCATLRLVTLHSALGEAALGKRSSDEKEDKPGHEEHLVALAKPRLLLVLLHQRNLA